MTAPVRARLGGALLVALGAAMIGYNFHTMASERTYSWQLFVAGGMGAAVGPLLLIAGRPLDASTGRPALWWNVASTVLAAFGAGLGAWYASTLGG